jgi:hypothetical protein
VKEMRLVHAEEKHEMIEGVNIIILVIFLVKGLNISENNNVYY